MCSYAPRVCSEPGGQRPVLSLSLDLINNIPALVQIMAWRRPGDKPLSEPTMVGLPTHMRHSASMSYFLVRCLLSAKPAPLSVINRDFTAIISAAYDFTEFPRQNMVVLKGLRSMAEVPIRLKWLPNSDNLFIIHSIKGKVYNIFLVFYQSS